LAETTLYHVLLIGWSILAAVVFILLFFFPAPYGRYSRSGWGPVIPDRIGWIVMEAPSALVFALCFLVGEHRDSITAWVFLGAWLFHYVYRAFIYPVRRRSAGRSMPLSVVLMAIGFNGVNGYLNGRYLFTFSGGYPNRWLMAPPFLNELTIGVTPPELGPAFGSTPDFLQAPESLLDIPGAGPLCRHEPGDRSVVLGDDDLLPFARTIQELRESRLGFKGTHASDRGAHSFPSPFN